MPKARAPLAPEKVRLVQLARARVGLREDDYRSLLMRVGGVTSSRALSRDGFRLLMDAFARLGFQSDSNAENLGRRPGFATAGQVAALRRLWSDYTGDEGTEGELGRWLERTWGVSALRFLSAEQGPKAVSAMRAMCRRRAGTSPPKHATANG